MNFPLTCNIDQTLHDDHDHLFRGRILNDNPGDRLTHACNESLCEDDLVGNSFGEFLPHHDLQKLACRRRSRSGLTAARKLQSNIFCANASNKMNFKQISDAVGM